jgi:hypothetical protein
MLTHLQVVSLPILSAWDMPILPPNEFPPLPQAANWSADILSAYWHLDSQYSHSLHTLQQEDGESICLKVLGDQWVTDGLLILEALAVEGLLEEWICLCIDTVASMVLAMEEALSATESVYVPIHQHLSRNTTNTANLLNRESSKMALIQPVLVAKTSLKAGQLRKIIHPVYLEEALHPRQNITIETLAKALGVSQSTVY